MPILGRHLQATGHWGSPSGRAPQRPPYARFLVGLVLMALLGACSGERPAPDVTFRTLTGEQLVLHELKAPVLVNFWATSCAICVAEMPQLVRLYEQLAPAGVRMVAVAMPYDPPNTVLDYVEGAELPFPVALDIDGQVLSAFEPVPGTPTRFVIDAAGQIIERQIGGADVDKLGSLLRGLVTPRS